MPIRRIVISLFAIAYLSLFTVTVKAQTDTPSDDVVMGEVTGILVNKSPDGVVPENIELMLHVWDQNSTEQGMYHGQSLPDGSFVFSDIGLNPALIYSVMASHDGAAYFSEAKAPVPEATSLEFELAIYETASHLSQVVIEQAHVLFYFDQGVLEVLEIYVLSNVGDYTVKDAVTLEDGQLATLAFELPENATSISFKNNSGPRFIQYPGGFADTSPLNPGKNSGQIIVSYTTPYEDRFSYIFQPPVMVNNLEFLVVQDEGITFEASSEDLTYNGVQTIQENINYDVYSHASLKAGESVEIFISGEPTIVSVPMTGNDEPERAPKVSSSLEIGLGALFLGFVLISLSVWRWRKLQTIDEDDTASLLDQLDYRELVSQIVELHGTYQAGEISIDDFERQRDALVLQGKELLLEEK